MIKNNIIQKIILILLFLIIIWFSIAGEHIQAIYHNYLLWVLFGLFIIPVVFNKRYREKLNNSINFSFVVFIFIVTISCLTAVNKKLAFDKYFFCEFLFLFFITFQNLNFKKIKLKISLFISILVLIIFGFGLLELILSKNYLYEFLVSNVYYEPYLKVGKMMSTQDHPCILATYFLGCLPFTFYCFLRNEKKYEGLGFISTFSAVIGLILTRTHFAFMAMFFLFAIYFLKDSKRKKIVAIIISIFLIFLFISILLSHISPVFREFSMLSKMHLYSLRYRLNRVIISGRMWKSSPIFGVGPGNFKFLFNKFSGGVTADYIHKVPDNMYLALLAETGTLGLLSFLCFVVLLLKRGFRKISEIKNKEDKKFYKLILYGFCALLIAMLGYEFLYWHTPLYLFGIYTVIVKQYL